MNYHFVPGILAFINCWDVKWATRVQDIFTYAKLLALFIIIFTGAYQLFTGKFDTNSILKLDDVLAGLLRVDEQFAPICVWMYDCLYLNETKRILDWQFEDQMFAMRVWSWNLFNILSFNYYNYMLHTYCLYYLITWYVIYYV